MRKGATLNDLLLEEMQNLYTAEVQIDKFLPELPAYALSKRLKAALKKHAGETKSRISTLEKVFQELAVLPKNKPNTVITDLLNCCLDIVEPDSVSTIQDIALIAFIQKLQLHQIATYDVVFSYATSLKYDTISELLGKSLEREIAKGNQYNDLAIRGITDPWLEHV